MPLRRREHLVGVAGRVDPNPQPVPLSGRGRHRAHALVEERAHRPPVVGRATPGPQRQYVPGFPAYPDQRRQRGLPGAGERRALLTRPVGAHPGGVRVDRQSGPLRGGAGGPRPAQHHPVGRRRLAHPAQVGAGEEAPQRRHARQRVAPAQRGRGRIGQQRPIGQEVPAGQQRLHQRPVARPAGIPARADRAQSPPVRLGDHVQPVQQRPPQHHPGNRGQLRLRAADHRRRHRPGGTRQHRVLDIEQQAGTIHLAGALLHGELGLQQSRFSRTARALPRYDTPSREHLRCKIRV